MRSHHPLLLCILGFFFQTLISAADEARKPNIIIINMDDLGYADIGPFGSKLNRTPNLDRMAKEGMKLSSFYAAPVCSPSRAALMTGCYPKRVLPIVSVLFPAASVGLHPQETTVAEMLKQVGYTTACIGKWHLGDQPEHLPNSQGFDEYLGLPYSNDMGTVEDGSKSDLGSPLPDKKLASLTGNDELGLRGHSQPPLPLVKNGKVISRVRQDEQQSLVELYTQAAAGFITASKDKPFFLYLPHNAVHFPIYPGKKWAGKSPHGHYSDWVEEVDWSVGKIFETLTQNNLHQRTLVLFTSDNGGTPRAINTPLRGNKGSTWEGGIRVPTLVWWPDHIPASSETHQITGMMDILPTLAAITSAPLPSVKLDGRNAWPLWSGKTQKGPHETFFYFRGLQLEAVRSGAWKLHLGSKNRTPERNKAKAKAQPSTPQLFNLDQDIGEQQNLADKHPEKVKELQELAQTQAQDLGLQEIGPGCRQLGRAPSPQPLLHPNGTIRPGFEP